MVKKHYQVLFDHFFVLLTSSLAHLSQGAVDWPEVDKPFLTHLLNQNESIGLVHQLNLRFKRMMRGQQADGLIEWCADLNGFVKVSVATLML